MGANALHSTLLKLLHATLFLVVCAIQESCLSPETGDIFSDRGIFSDGDVFSDGGMFSGGGVFYGI